MFVKRILPIFFCIIISCFLAYNLYIYLYPLDSTKYTYSVLQLKQAFPKDAQDKFANCLEEVQKDIVAFPGYKYSSFKGQVIESSDLDYTHTILLDAMYDIPISTDSYSAEKHDTYYIYVILDSQSGFCTIKNLNYERPGVPKLALKKAKLLAVFKLIKSGTGIFYMPTRSLKYSGWYPLYLNSSHGDVTDSIQLETRRRRQFADSSEEWAEFEFFVNVHTKEVKMFNYSDRIPTPMPLMSF